MTATGPEQNGGTKNNEIEALRQEVARQTREQLAEQIRNAAKIASDVKASVELQIKAGKAPDLSGDKDNKDSPKGKATTVKQVVQKTLLAAKIPDKIPIPTGKSAEIVATTSTIIQKLGNHINPEYDIADQDAPYIHQIIYKAVNGELTGVEDLKTELKNIEALSVVSPLLYKKVQDAFVDVVKEKENISSIEEARKRLGIEGVEQQQETHGYAGRGSFEGDWREHYSSYFNEEDKPFVASLYSVKDFINFTGQLQDKFAKAMNMDRNSEAVLKAVSKDIERRTVELFGKLYTRLDHEKPSEFFHEIEQQDIMRGILPVKNELKRRMIRLAFDLEKGEHEGSLPEMHMFKSVEMKTDVVDMQFKDKDGEQRIKPRYRLNPYTQPMKTSAGDFIHYLDQIVDHYIEARKYTHNARAIFLHPVDHEKGFYGQLSQFANDMSMVDFDQIMALPDNEVFRDAFSLYDKMVEETFASNDWRHFPTMFELKQNSLHTQVEEDVLEKLKIMYAPQIKSGEMTQARLEAALSMAVGASRGMFLNEIEKAAFADPHLTEDGRATFASYYNQDASALLAFNPMHQHFRWQATNTIDPILFMPVEGVKGTSGYFTDHRTLWKKMQGYRDSFLSGRGKTGLEGETLWADFLVNVGRVGGPIERKGWRLSYMLEPLYVRNEAIKDDLKYDYVKTWMRFENIGYEVMSDLVGKLPFLGEYKGRHGGDADMLRQKNELFTYIYEKYFNGEEGGVDGYLKSMRSAAEAKIRQKINAGEIRPKDIREQVEVEVSNQFLYRALARMIGDRIPSKILRIDRDRHSKEGVSRWRTIAQKMGLSTAQFDDVMKDLLTAEQLLRKDVSAQMKQMLAEGKEPWRHGEIHYRLTENKIEDLLKDKLTPERIEQVKQLYRTIKEAYLKPEFLDREFAPYLRNGEYKFSFALDELDMSFIPWRGAGARVLPRAIGDISTIEKNVAAELIKLPKTLQQMAIDGKKDFTPVIEIMTKVYGALDGIIGTDYAHRLVHHIAGLTINYFKKDMTARAFYGLFGLGRKNSLAAERAGGSTRVWEWDAMDIDRFCMAIESRALLPHEPFQVTNSKPTYTPVYLKVPFINKFVKLPESLKIGKKEIRLFQKRKPDFEFTIKNLKKDFGGNWKDMAFDYLNKYLPLVLAWLLFKYMSDALKETEGKKK